MYFTFSYYFMFDRIVSVLLTFYQRGHFGMLMIRNLNLINVQSWTYLDKVGRGGLAGIESGRGWGS